jgi:uncharacterized repeat protein (TIGR01451 family)
LLADIPLDRIQRTRMSLKSGFIFAIMLLAIFVTAVVLTAPVAHAAGTWYVAPAPTGDDGYDCATPTTPCASINAALNKAGFVAGDTVRVANGTYYGSGSEVVRIDKNATLSGGWDNFFATQSGMSTIDGENARRGIVVTNGVSASLNRIVVQNGYGDYKSGGILNDGGNLTVSESSIINNVAHSYGGGIYQNGGTLNLTKTLVARNSSIESGGGLYASFGVVSVTASILTENFSRYGAGISNNFGTLSINNTTISNNTLPGGFGGYAHGSGIYDAQGTLFVNNTTISGNKGGDGEGLYSWANGTVFLNNSSIISNQGYGLQANMSTVMMQNTIIAHNGENGVGQVDCYDQDLINHMYVQSLGYNLIKTNRNCVLAASDLINLDPQLGLLQDNGGPTYTHALLTGSPAIDAGNSAGCLGNSGVLATDQRGLPRVGRCDIGAYEEQLPFSASIAVDRSKASPGNVLHYQIISSKGGPGGISNALITDTLPVNLIYLNNSLSTTKGSVGYSNGTMTWNGSINSNESITITYDARVNPGAPGGNIISNLATIAGAGTVFTRTASTLLVSNFESAYKRVDKTLANLGDSLQYTIGFTESSLLQPTNVVMTDTMASQLSYIPNSLTANIGDASYANGTIRWNGTVNPAGIVTITYGAMVSPSAPLGSSIMNSVAINGDGEIITRSASTSILAYTYIPLLSVSSPCAGICGRVTLNGVKASGVPLELRFFNGSSWSTLAAIATGVDGYYSFVGMPALTSAQKYYVRYLNSSDNSRLYSWSTRVLTSYAAGTTVAIGNFDIANIVLGSPAPGATVPLPTSFQWTARPATTSDSYELDLYDPYNPSLAAWTSSLGYVGSTTIGGLPSGFYINTQYAWYVGVYSPDGGYGTSYYAYGIKFSSAGSAAMPRVQSKAQQIRDDWRGKPPVQLKGIK